MVGDATGYINDYKSAERVVVLCRRFVYPQHNSVRFEDPDDTRQKPVKDLFSDLGIPEGRLTEVYEFRGGKFTGRFTGDGKQRLADILGKEVVFYNRVSGYEPDTKDPETFQPNINSN